ncbi:hypothetical protein PGTUg99_025229 [Puccinia graminis f. sp. tritici]|uniref:Uncharacterized protein n=1 Tax=Puccinia graminis f. sp. tritici TaxID=56615 RepID=A0A5B0PIG6_PUCGR|nr:hypothetical protein PGTUg99_025229 [Puccinia graminis f. sp. tritici]
MYLAGWKETLPVGEVHASPAGRQPFQSTRYMPRRLEGPCRLEGNPSSRPLVSGIPGDTRISAGIWGGERTSAPESASPGGYPLALADIRQRIADIRNGLSPPISIVSSVSVTSGHQIGRTNPSNPTPLNSSPLQGRKFTKFLPKSNPSSGPSSAPAPKPNVPVQTPHGSSSSAQRGPTPNQVTKGKSKATSEYETEGEELSNNDETDDSDAELPSNTTPQTKRGRPRKNIVKEAAKRMRKN